MIMDARLRRITRLVVLLNLGYFGIEFAVGLAIGSVSLFADSIDFLEDAAVNMLVLLALGWSAVNRARVGRMLALLIIVPGISTLWMAWLKVSTLAVPGAVPLTLAGVGALAVNMTCSMMLARYRKHGGALVRAAYLSARNDVLANVAIIAAGAITLRWVSTWPDLIVGFGIFLLNATAALEVWKAARQEQRQAVP